MLGTARWLTPHLALESAAGVLAEEGITTSAIEGERLPPDAVRSSVAKHLGLAAVGLPNPSRNVTGLVQVLIDATQGATQPLTLKRLCGWQASLFPTGFSDLTPLRVGKLRGDAPMEVVSGRVGKQRVHFVAPPGAGLRVEVERFLNWFNQPDSLSSADGLIRAAVAHFWFVTLHPFEDGNGRLARAITDMALAQDEKQPMRTYSMSAQILTARDAYYDVLERSQRGNLNLTPWLIWFLQQTAIACTRAEEVVGRTLLKAQFWLAHQSLELHPRQRKMLNRLLDAGPTGFEGGMTTRKYMNLTRASRATAYRELSYLLNEGCLTALPGGGRSAAYQLVWPDPPSFPYA